MTTLHERLGYLVRCAPPGTLIPVAALAELLHEHAPEPARHATAGLSLGEVAERFARGVAGKRRVPQEGTVRKWIRVGLRGVRLKAFRAGRTLRVLEPDLDAFVAALAARPDAPADGTPPAPEGPPPSPEHEIEAYLQHYRRQSRPLAGRARRGRHPEN